MDRQSIAHAFIASFLVLGTAAGDGTLQRASHLLRDALKEPKLNPVAAGILEDILGGIEQVDSGPKANVGWNHAAA